MQPLIDQLNVDAQQRFNERGQQLLRSVTGLREPPKKPPAFKPDTHISSHVTDANIIGDVHLTWQNQLGDDVGKAFVRPDGLRVGLFGAGYASMIDIAGAMRRVKPFSTTASAAFIEDHIFDWVKASVRAETSDALVEWVVTKLEAQVDTFQIVVPIAGLHVQSDLPLGTVTFKTFPVQFIEQLEAARGEDLAEQAQHLAWCTKLREKFQGLAAAHVTAVAEPKRAIEDALEGIDLAVGVLRLFAPAHIDPKQVSRVAPFGEVPSPKRSVFVANSAGRCVQMTDGLLDPASSMLIDDSLRQFLEEIGLQELRQLLQKPDRTAFDTALLSSISLFGRAALTSDLRERLVWYFAGLESMLLQNSSESITQNVADRLALFSYSTLADRQVAITDVRKAYDQRSAFVHHGSTVEDRRVVGALARHGVRLFLALLKRGAHFNNKEMLFKHLETIRLSGSANQS